MGRYYSAENGRSPRVGVAGEREGEPAQVVQLPARWSDRGLFDDNDIAGVVESLRHDCELVEARPGRHEDSLDYLGRTAVRAALRQESLIAFDPVDAFVQNRKDLGICPASKFS